MDDELRQIDQTCNNLENKKNYEDDEVAKLRAEIDEMTQIAH